MQYNTILFNMNAPQVEQTRAACPLRVGNIKDQNSSYYVL